MNYICPTFRFATLTFNRAAGYKRKMNTDTDIGRANIIHHFIFVLFLSFFFFSITLPAVGISLIIRILNFKL